MTTRTYDPHEFPPFAVTVDTVVLTMSQGRLHVLLVRRGVPPFKGMWAIPGGFKRPEESLLEAAQRELCEETGVAGTNLLRQFGAYGDPDRDPRMNVVTVAYLAVLRDVRGIAGGTDAAAAALVPVSEALGGDLGLLAFDHGRILHDAIERVRVDLALTGIATAFVGPTFTLAELRAVYEEAWGVRIDGANFRRSVLADEGWVVPTGRRAPSGPAGGKPAELYRGSQVEARCADKANAISQQIREESMKAVIFDRYGPPEVLRVGDVDWPVLKEREVLVKVHASTVTRGQAMGVRSAEYRFTRVFTGIRHPRTTSFGSEFAGRVEEVAEGVAEFQVGDDVFGIRTGANAEYLAVPEGGVIAPKPAMLSYEQAAAIPDGSLLALTCLRPADPQGKRVLVYGAAGSVGSAAVQLLAHHFGAEVTAVCDTKDLEVVQALGAQVALDRLHEDFTVSRTAYDVIFDAVGKSSFRRCRHSLVPGGTYVTMDLGYMYHAPLLALVTRFVGSRRARVGVGRYRKEDLLLISELVEQGKYRPVIDRRYALDDVVAATRYVETGQKTGNVVLTIP